MKFFTHKPETTIPYLRLDLQLTYDHPVDNNRRYVKAFCTPDPWECSLSILVSCARTILADMWKELYNEIGDK